MKFKTKTCLINIYKSLLYKLTQAFDLATVSNAPTKLKGSEESSGGDQESSDG